MRTLTDFREMVQKRRLTHAVLALVAILALESCGPMYPSTADRKPCNSWRTTNCYDSSPQPQPYMGQTK